MTGRTPQSTPTLTLDPADCDGVVFDMDGVLTDTTRIHARAWKQMFDVYLDSRDPSRGEDLRPFDIGEDYRRHVDGRPRYDGVRSFLTAREIELDEGDPEDPPGRETVCGLGNRKNRIFRERLREDGARPFPDAVALVRALREAGIATAVFSASRNAALVLEQAGIADLFDTRVDGEVAAEAGLPGKPAPDVPLEAARRIGAAPERAVVVEDARAGVRAGRRGGFGLVVGVARDGDPGGLAEAGAEVVVRDLSELGVARRENPGTDARRPLAELPSAFDRLDTVLQRVGDRQVVLLLDFDGTLAPIVDRPEEATLPQATRALLRDLAERHPVAIVSGRDLADLRDRVGLESVYYAGSHGFRLAGPDGWSREHPEACRFLPALDEAQKRLEAWLGGVEGVQVERKRYAVAVHFRRAAPDAEDAVRDAAQAVLEHCEGLRTGEGRQVLELRPAIDLDKGEAVDWLLEGLGLSASRVFPIYIGDDVTDEDAFRAVAEDGLAVGVRGRTGRTRAESALDDPEAVRRFLLRLDEVLP